MKRKALYQFFMVTVLMISMAGCVTAPPRNPDNICRIFRQYPKWYWDAQKVQRKWHVSMPTLMSIMHQESGFRADAKPPRTKLLWIIPWTRPSSAYGYSQALKDTWKHYKRTTGHHGADRDEFGDAADFIGWYANQAKRKAGIAPYDSYKLYLAYHEGIGGYQRGTYLRKPWLMNVAKKVQSRAWLYRKQLTGCESELPQKPWYRFW
ncbi:MAG: transglycosylase SLT domain-containing protein [Proteobacteria bacterium]|nr:transglycosylase SLT domain-containing protein [Pseudomonadota bacterium]